MKITVLIENTTKNPKLMSEHGLSIYVETKEHKLLFDVGQSGFFINNAKKLHVNLEEVDTVILSHGHYDHVGGLKAFLEINKTAKIYIREEAFRGLYSKKSKVQMAYIGIDLKYKSHPRFILLKEDLQIDEELRIFINRSTKYQKPSMNKTLYQKDLTLKDQSLDYVLDDFSHEQNLVITQDNQQLLLAGCAHNGILNILETYYNHYKSYPRWTISGFHLASDRTGFVEETSQLEIISQYLEQTEGTYYTGHCTGKAPFDYLKNKLKEEIHHMPTGSVIAL